MKKKVLAVVLLVSMLCTGCSGVKVTTEQNDLMAEYAAGVLLKYSYENEWNNTKLNKAKASQNKGSSSYNSASSTTTSSGLSSIPGVQAGVASCQTAGQTTTQSATAAASSNGTGATATDAMKLIADAAGMSAATVSYSKYVVCDTYPQEELTLGVSAEEGKKIVAVEFNIANNTSNLMTSTMSNSSMTLKLAVNGEAAVTQTLTMLNYDVLNLNGSTIDPGQSKTAVAVFMIPTDKASQITGLTLTVTANGYTGNATLQ